jgi:hypothetical protein
MHSFVRRAIMVYRRRQNASLIRKRRRRKLPLNTPQWLVLTLGIATLVGAIFIVALLYLQPGR